MPITTRLAKKYMFTTVSGAFLATAEVIVKLKDGPFARMCRRSDDPAATFRRLDNALGGAAAELEHSRLSEHAQASMKELAGALHDMLYELPWVQRCFGEPRELIDLLGRCAYAKPIDLLGDAREGLTIPIHMSYFPHMHSAVVATEELTHSLLREQSPIASELAKLKRAAEAFRGLSRRAERLRSTR